jgi:cell division transport system permease protein
MRLRHIFAETGGGLRRNLTMTVAVILTMWISLSLLGAGLLAQQEVHLAKNKWFNKVEVSVFLCSTSHEADNCRPSKNATEQQKVTIRKALESSPAVAPGSVHFVSKHEAYQNFKKSHQDNPVNGAHSENQMQESFRVQLTDPDRYQSLTSAVGGLPGVQSVQDMHKVLGALFSWVKVVQWGAIASSLLLLGAAVLQITTTIRLAAFARRREIGIMRLVGASNFSITLPFLLESIIAALIGAALSCGTLAAAVYFGIMQKAAVSVPSLRWIGWHETFLAMGAIAIVGLLLAIIPTLVTTRRYLRV